MTQPAAATNGSSATRDERGAAAATDVLPQQMLRLWRVFALGWTFMLAPTLYVAFRMGDDPFRLGTGVLAIAIVAVMYLRLTYGPGAMRSHPVPNGDARAGRRSPIPELAAMGALVLVVSVLLPRLGAWWLIMFPTVAAGLVLPPRRATIAIGLMLVVALLASRLISGRVEVMLVVVVAIGGGAMAIRQLTVTLAQLESARTALAHRAVDQERLRIARDLHDLLGRTLSVIVLKSELAARRLPDSPALAAAEMRDVERAGREALHHIRSAVSGYRTPTVSSELAIARQLLDAQGIAAEIADGASRLPPAADALLAWTIREGVTNVMRHSRASRCRIEVRREDGVAWVSVVDDGRGGRVGVTVDGHGLMGLRERAEARGGQLCAGPRPDGGYQLSMHVPLDVIEGAEP